ncbi:uncharacterized protein LJ206_020632 [Theristicus caerulescens]
MPARSRRQRRTHQKDRSVPRLLFLLLPVLSALVYCRGSTVWGKGALWEASRIPEAEQESRGHSQAWLEQKMRALKETEAQGSAVRGNILQAVSEVLGDHGVQEEKREEILQLTEAATKKVLENYPQMGLKTTRQDWALEAIVCRGTLSLGAPLPYRISEGPLPEWVRVVGAACPGSSERCSSGPPAPIRSTTAEAGAKSAVDLAAAAQSLKGDGVR